MQINPNTGRSIKWYYTNSGRPNSIGYAHTILNGKSISMHRLIMDCPKGLEVDHRDHNTRNNQKDNLRICTRSQNAKNMKISKGVSEYKGIRLRKSGRWTAVIMIDYQEINLGTYDTEIVAALAYDYKSREIHKEFGYPNFSEDVFNDLWLKFGAIVLDPKTRKGTSKYIGVSWSKRDKKWVAHVCHNKTLYYVGYFNDEEEAHFAREKFKKDLLGNE